MKRYVYMLFLSVCLLLFAVAGFAANNLDTGILTSTSGLSGTSNWAADMSFSWNVSLSNNVFTYTYVLSDNDTLQAKNISHMILQVSDNFTDSNIWDFSINNIAATPIIQTWTNQEGNPGIPANVYGIKIQGGVGATWNIAFKSDHAPMWGNFYSKDGKTNQIDNTVFNSDFTSGILTDTNRYNFDSIGNYIAVPDTTIVPEPAVLAGLLAFMPGVVFLAKKRV